MRSVKLWGVLALCLLAVAGCTYEKIQERSLPGPPAWVVDTPLDTPTAKVFVGIGLADNILDERVGRERAMEDAAAQIAASLKTTVVKDAMDIVKKKGPEHKGEDVASTSYYRSARTLVSQSLAGAKQVSYYWEKWKISPGFWSSTYTKYKYYVKVEMPKKDYDLLQQRLTEVVAASITP